MKGSGGMRDARGMGYKICEGMSGMRNMRGLTCKSF